MTYIPLHHKYRPQTFTQLVGQDAIATTLSNALEQNRIAPAYLFTGARGTGKTSSARIFAKSLNCVAQAKPTSHPCGVCETCKEIAKGAALDVIEIDAASNTGVDHIRELIERAQFAPVQCRYKVYVIDECLTGDSLVQTSEGLCRIDNPHLEGKQVLSYNEISNDWEYKKVVRWLDQGERQVYIIKTGTSAIRCTGNHLIRTEQGWLPARDLKEGMKILSPVPVAVGSLSTNTALIGVNGGLLEGINSSETHLAANPTTLKPFLPKQNLSVLSALVGVVKNYLFLNSSNRKGKDWSAFNLGGKITLSSRDMELGRSAPKTSLTLPSLFLLHNLDWYTGLSWEMGQLATPMSTVGFHDWSGLTELHNTLGSLTKLNNFRNLNRSLPFWTMQVTEQLLFDVQPAATLSFKKWLTWFVPIEQTKQFLRLGWNELRQQGVLGGIWTMDRSVFPLKEAHKSNSTPKDSLSQKIRCWLNGWVNAATPLPLVPMCVPVPTSDTTISRWERKQPEDGSRITSNSPFLKWHTKLETVESVSLAGVENVYDIEVEDNHNFVANGLLVHNCHMLSAAAFNALLKTLEEPPDRVVFVLATTDPQRVLPTIISRCQRFDFRRIPLDAMIQHLGEIAQKEAIPIADDALYLVAQISQGGLRDAESLLDQLSLLTGEITVDRVWDLVGAVPERDLMSLLEAIASDNPEPVLDTTRRLMDRGREPLIVLQNLASFYRDLLIAKTSPNRGDLVALTTPAWQALCEFASAMDIKTILAGQKHLKDSEVQLKHSTQPRLWLEVTLLGLLPAAVQGAVGPAASVAPVRTAPKPSVKPQSPPPPAEPSEPPAATEATPTSEQPSLTDLWQQILLKIQPPGTQALLKQQGSLLAFSDQEAEIGIKSDKLLNMAQSKLTNIRAAFQQVVGHEIRVTMTVAAQSAAPPEAPPAAPVEAPRPEPTPQPDAKPEVPEVPAPTESSEPSQLLPDSYSIETNNWDEDEVTRAARSLAEAFNGAIVDLEREETVTPTAPPATDQLPTLDVADPEEEADEDDEDVPF